MSIGVNVTIEITRDEATPALRRLQEHLDGVDMRDAMARGTALLVRNHLDELNTTRGHQGGGRRTNMYAAASRQTTHELIDDGFRVAIAHEAIGLRYFGGVVRPVNAKLLAIPVDPSHPGADPEAADAYGESPRKFHHLRLVMFGKTGKGALIARNRTNITRDRRKSTSTNYRGESIHGGLFYWLVPEATHKPDPAVLPTDDELATAALDAGDNYLDALLDEKGAR